MPFNMIAAALALGLLCSAAAAADLAPANQPAGVVMTQQIDFTSNVNGHTYRVQIARPFAPPPPGGFPVLYVLDGDAYFGTYASAARLLAATHELESAIVVGIGYPDSQNNAFNSMIRRNYDLTPYVDEEAAKTMSAMIRTKVDFGHAEEFFKVIETEIKPRIAAAAPINPNRNILFGHSLGGLFVIHTLFTHPDAFQTFLALSPSLFFDHRAVLGDEAAFSRLVTAGKAAPRVFIAVGGDESKPPRHGLVPGLTKEMEERTRINGAMIENARSLANRLSALKGPDGYAVNWEVFPGQTHQSSAWVSVIPFLNFALPLPSEP